MRFFRVLKKDVQIILKYIKFIPENDIQEINIDQSTNVSHIARNITNRTRIGTVRHINKVQVQRQRTVRLRRMAQKR